MVVTSWFDLGASKEELKWFDPTQRSSDVQIRYWASPLSLKCHGLELWVHIICPLRLWHTLVGSTTSCVVFKKILTGSLFVYYFGVHYIWTKVGDINFLPFPPIVFVRSCLNFKFNPLALSFSHSFLDFFSFLIYFSRIHLKFFTLLLTFTLARLNLNVRHPWFFTFLSIFTPHFLFFLLPFYSLFL